MNVTFVPIDTTGAVYWVRVTLKKIYHFPLMQTQDAFRIYKSTTCTEIEGLQGFILQTRCAMLKMKRLLIPTSCT